MPAIAILALIALGGLFFGWSNSAKLDAAKQSVTDQVKAVQQSEAQDLTAVKDRLATDEKTNADLQGDLKVVTDKLKITQSQLRKARTEAAQLNTETTQKLSALDTSVHTELATKATNDDVKTVDTKVSTVSEQPRPTTISTWPAANSAPSSPRTMMKSTFSAAWASATTSNSPSLARISPRRSAMLPSSSRA
jgi:hypothetical protein